MRTHTAAALVPALVVAAAAHADLIDFEDRAPGESFAPTTTFVSGGVTLSVLPFAGDNAVFITNSDNTNTPGPDNEANVNNAVLGVNFISNFAAPADGVVFFYGEFGGTNELFINGVGSGAVGDFTTLDGVILGGSSVSVFPTGPNTGRISLSGPISNFGVGGQELWIDDIRFPTIPAPGAVTLAGVGALALLRRRR